MAKTTHEIVGGALLEMLNSRADRQQAQLDLERATAAEQYATRTTVPGVFAQLKANADKEAAQKAKIAKQQEAGQPSPQSMTPPMTEVSGQANPRSAAGAIKAAGDIASTILGGGGLKRGQVGPQGGGLPGSTGGINPNAGQQPVQVAGPGVPTGTTQNPPPSAPPPGTPVAPPPGTTHGPTGPPGTTQPVTRDLSGVERYLVGPTKIVGGVLTRNGGLGTSGVQDLFSGKEIIDYQRVPTVPEQAAPLAKPLTVYAQGALGPEPGRAAIFQHAFDQRIEQIRHEFGDDMANSTYNQAMDAAAAIEYARALKDETPKAQLERFHAEALLGIEEHLNSGGTLEQLPKGLQQLYDKSGRGTTVNVDNRDMGVLTKAAQTQVQEARIATLPVLQAIDTLDAAYYAPGYTAEGKARYKILQGKEASPLMFGALTDAETDELGQFNANQKALDGLTIERLTAIAGKAMTETEIKWVVKTLVPQLGGTSAKQALGTIREQFGLANFRYSVLLGDVPNPSAAMQLGDVKALALSTAQEKMNTLQGAGGYTPEMAKAQVVQDFRAQYGLDLNRLLDSTVSK